ncbi:MAG: glutamyl-tRNA reductase [bacterium]
MHILLIGLNHESTPVELREKLAFQPKRLGVALTQLTQQDGQGEQHIAEAVILSTCNRVEIYALTEDCHQGARSIKEFLSRFHKTPLVDFEACLYERRHLSAVEHLFCVTSGIDSMILGETQIQGQVKQAFELAQEYHTVGPFLSNLFRNALTVGKRVRSETAISEHSLSISHAAVDLVRTRFDNPAALNLLVLGLGKMSFMAVKALRRLGVRNLTVINRRPEHALELTKDLPVKIFGFDHLESCVRDADVIISSTAAPHTLLGFEQMRQIMNQRSHKNLMIIDIAVPRDIEPEVGRLENVSLYNIDQLQNQIGVNLERRCEAVNNAKDIIDAELTNFLNWLRSLEVKPVITELRDKVDEIRLQEVDRALRRFEKDLSENDANVVRELSHRIINKILHTPLVRLREEAANGNGHVYAASVKNLFDLSTN